MRKKIVAATWKMNMTQLLDVAALSKKELDRVYRIDWIEDFFSEPFFP